MKKYFFSITLSFIYFNSYAQIDVDLIGRWKPLFVSSSEFYYNFKTDSCFFPKSLESKFSDSLVRKQTLSNFKSLYGMFHIEFERNGRFKQFTDTLFLFEGKYQIMPTKNIVILSGDNSNIKKDKVKLDYYYKNHVLFLSLKNAHDESEYVLERQQK